MKTRTLLIDSNALLKRSFHGAKNTYTRSFGAIGGLYSFLTTTRKMVRDNKINKVVAVWDGECGGKLRHDILFGYKANRVNKEWSNKIVMSDAEIKRESEKDESILKNRKRIQAYLEEIFVRQVEVSEVEGDDIISAYCIKHHNNEEIFISTNDRDFSQLLDLGITILFHNIPEPITKSNYFFRFGYHYLNALTVKIICGDVSDNMVGIDGVGIKTLLTYFPELILRYVSVKEICERVTIINKERVLNNKNPLKCFENLLNNIPLLKTNHKLMNLREPFLNEEAEDELLQLEMPLSPNGRGSKNLYKLMMEDEFLTIYTGTFVNYVEPFYTVITHEKDLLKEWQKNNENKPI